jgi:ubiquinone/menaquinone biosynthesis C-methylase UbiE
MIQTIRPAMPGGNGGYDFLTADTVDDRYIMGRTDAEYDRLRRQAAVWEPATVQVLDDIGIQPGMRCLDVGSGVGSVSALMASRVGPQGQVVCLDSDSRVGQIALIDLHRRGYHQVSFKRGDVNQTNEIAPGSFDVVFGRFLLLHMVDPAATLRRMYGWVKPGGWLVIQDYDCLPLEIHPQLPLVAEFRRVFFAVMAQTGRDLRLGLKLRAIFAQAAAGDDVTTRVHARQTTLAEAAEMIAGVYRSVLPMALELGVTNDRDGVLAKSILELPNQNAYAVLWPLLHSAWTRKPA